MLTRGGGGGVLACYSIDKGAITEYECTKKKLLSRNKIVLCKL